MYQYKAVLKSTKTIIAEGHNIEDVEKLVIHFKREQKYGEHTRANDPVEIFHVKRNQESGIHKDELVKII